jgi:hypothetical protein
MAKIKQTFQAEDGKEFATELEADAHDRGKKEETAIVAYCEAVGLQKAQLGLLRKHIPGFLIFAEKRAAQAAAG